MPKWKLLLAPPECCISPHIHIYGFVYKEWEDCFHPIPLCHVNFTLLSRESFPKPRYCFPTPAHSTLKLLAATGIVYPETVPSIDMQQAKSLSNPAKWLCVALLWRSPLIFPFQEAINSSPRKVIWADEKSDRLRTPCVDRPLAWNSQDSEPPLSGSGLCPLPAL